jgi:nanoRNase/pAp phosphatase (c-di-AMP/oligoRNAs hydrolase)
MKSIESSASQIKELIQHARTVLVVTSAETFDNVAASLALAESIKNFGREVILASPNELSAQAGTLPGASEFRHQLGPKALIISLPYQTGSIEKINYETVGDKFNLMIVPPAGSEVTADQVEFSQNGPDYDLVVVVGTVDLPKLGNLYLTEEKTWVEMPIINIDYHSTNTQFGKINAVDPDAVTSSEVITRTINLAKLPMTKGVIDLLLVGLKDATSGFDRATAGAFQAAALLARAKSAGPVESTEERLVNEPFRKTQGELATGPTK